MSRNAPIDPLKQWERLADGSWTKNEKMNWSYCPLCDDFHPSDYHCIPNELYRVDSRGADHRLYSEARIAFFEHGRDSQEFRELATRIVALITSISVLKAKP